MAQTDQLLLEQAQYQNNPFVEKGVPKEGLLDIFSAFDAQFHRQVELLLSNKYFAVDPELAKLLGDMDDFRRNINVKAEYQTQWEVWASNFLDNIMTRSIAFFQKYGVSFSANRLMNWYHDYREANGNLSLEVEKRNTPEQRTIEKQRVATSMTVLTELMRVSGLEVFPDVKKIELKALINEWSLLETASQDMEGGEVNEKRLKEILEGLATVYSRGNIRVFVSQYLDLTLFTKPEVVEAANEQDFEECWDELKVFVTSKRAAVAQRIMAISQNTVAAA